MIAILGVGKLGTGFAERCRSAGLELTVWNRTPGRAERLRGRGVRLAGRPQDAVRDADLVLCALSTGDVARRVLREAGDALEGRAVVNLTSTSSGEARRIHDDVRDRGGAFLDAATVSMPDQISAGEGVLVLGCSPGDLTRWRGLLETFGEVHHAGGVGSASMLEMATGMQLFLQAHAYLSSCALANRHGVPLDTLARLTQANVLVATPMIDMYHGYTRTRTYTPAVMTVAHYRHTLRLVIDDLELAGLDTGLWRAVLEVADRAERSCGAEADWTSVYECLR
ncbi:NAD(P)-binding domain-containing protein [Sphaerisporangium sp. B11E5]|uniref:NAD(P)-dependent oxidoreductase n=1 Tax=Sphaerisporangium sp. B11E5 TaxID=3153563 RepID=UPI00325C90A8